MSKRGRTVQIVAEETKISQIDELAEFRGDRPWQHEERFFSKWSTRGQTGAYKKVSKRGVPISWLLPRERHCMLMSLPNAEGIDPGNASAWLFSRRWQTRLQDTGT
jgi:hypothetical protein